MAKLSDKKSTKKRDEESKYLLEKWDGFANPIAVRAVGGHSKGSGKESKMGKKMSKLRNKPMIELTDPELMTLILSRGEGSVIETRTPLQIEIPARKHRGGPRRDPELVKISARIRQLKAEGKTHAEIATLMAQEGVFREADANRKLVGPKKGKKR
jgi:hypothetical protein